jgi:14-3-3 protein epsilon
MTVADFAFLAQVTLEVDRRREAIDYLSQLISLQPALDEDQRPTFQTIFKKAVDAHRHNLRYFDQRIVQEEGHSAILDRLAALRARELSELTDLANEAFTLIDEKLLPNATMPVAIVFFQKMRADFSRYLCEFTDGEALQEAKAAAESAYAAALETANRDLTPKDPARLGAVLNYAVFKYEHCQLCQEAAELLQDAIDGVGADKGEIAEEANEIIAVMTTNLENWGKGGSYEGEEESQEE